MKNLPENTQKKPGRTIYDPSHHLKKEPVTKILLVGAAVIIMLAAFHFINQVIRWNTTKLEIVNNELTRERLGNYTFLGLSNGTDAREKLETAVGLQIRPFTVVSYFDFFHSAVFLVHSRTRDAVINTGIMMTYPPKGFTDIYFHPTEIVESRQNEAGSRAVYYGSSLFPGIYYAVAGAIAGNGIGEGSPHRGLSFILNQVEDSTYLKIPYYAYFYLPLLTILILAAYYGRVFYTAFFYYVGLFLLFDFKRVLFTIPFSWLIDILGVDISPSAAAIGSAVMAAIFVIVGFTGIFTNRKKISPEQFLTPWGKGLIFFFILLPLALRF